MREGRDQQGGRRVTIGPLRAYRVIRQHPGECADERCDGTEKIVVTAHFIEVSPVGLVFYTLDDRGETARATRALSSWIDIEDQGPVSLGSALLN